MLCFGMAALLNAQETATKICGVAPPHQVDGSQPDSEIIQDRFGNTYYRSDLIAGSAARSSMNCVNSGSFEIQLAAVFTPQEEAVICAVFDYLSTVVVDAVEPGRILLTKAFIQDARVLAFASAEYIGNENFGGCGMVENLLTRRMLYGRPSDMRDGQIVINANSNFHVSLDDSDPPDGSYDFYSVVLHEAMHVLGFASRIRPDGSAVNNQYTYWDRQLGRGPLASQTDADRLLLGVDLGNIRCCEQPTPNPTFNFPDDIWNNPCGDERIIFPVASEPTVGTVYQDQDEVSFLNSLSHFDETCDDVDEYVTYGLFDDGADSNRRILDIAEIQALCLLGYQTSLECNNNCNVLAEPDGIFQLEIGDVVELAVDDLMSNDLVPAGTTFEYVGPAPSVTGISVEFLGETIEVTANGPGVHRIFYDLNCNESCDRGVIHIFIQEEVDCLDDCQLIADPGFELYGDLEYFNFRAAVTRSSGGIPPFFFREGESINTPELVPNVFPFWFGRCGDSGDYMASNNGGNVAHFWEEPSSSTEGMAIELCRPILPGEIGVISFEAITTNSCQAFNPRVQINFTNAVPVSGEVISVNPGLSPAEYLVPIVNDGSVPPGFVYVDPVEFVNDTDEAWAFIVISANSVGATENQVSYMIDDLKVTISPPQPSPVTATAEFLESCLGDVPSSLTARVSLCSDRTPITFNVLETSLTLPEGLELAPGAQLPTTITFSQGSECVEFDVELISTAEISLNETVGIDLLLSEPNGCSGFWEQDVVLELTVPNNCSPCVPCTGENAFEINAGNGLFLTNSILPEGGLFNGCLNLTGRLIINSNYRIESSQINMGPGAVIEVEFKDKLELFDNNITACTQMWRSIIVNFEAILDATNNDISDGEYAFELKNGSRSLIQNNRFDGNHIGVYVAPFSSGNLQELIMNTPITGNSFTCSNGCNLAEPYPGQTTIPGSLPLAGIWVEDLKEFTVGNLANPTVDPNIFDNLRNGVVAYSTALNVYGTDMSNILSDGADFANDAPNGTGIFAKDAFLLASENNIDNVEVGIHGYNSRLQALDNSIMQAAQGIHFEGAETGSEAVSNVIEFVNNGIVNSNADNGSVQSIIGNTLTKLEIDRGTAISLQNKSASIEESLVMNNTLNIYPRTYGFVIWQWDEALVENNTINYLPSPPIQGWRTFGIWLYSCTGTRIYGNEITSTANIDFDLHGVAVTQSPNTTICCTNTKGMRFGFSFGGKSLGTSISGCRMEGHYQMMFFEDSGAEAAEIGTQNNNYNEWVGAPVQAGPDFAHAYYGGIGNIVANAKFITRGSCGATTTPEIVIYNGSQQNCPGGNSDWFEVENIPVLVFDCGTDEGKCPGYESAGIGKRLGTDGALKLPSNSTISEFIVVPNPVNDLLTITGQSMKEKRVLIDLFDANGRIVRSMKTNAKETRIMMDVASLTPGVYLLRMSTKDGHVEGRRIVISR